MSTWNLSETKHHVLICNGGSCLRNQGEEITVAIREEIALHGAEDRIHTTRTRCNGRCEDACVVIVYPEGTWYKELTPQSAKKLVREHLLQGKPLTNQVSYYYENHYFHATGNGPQGALKRDISSHS